MDLLPKIVREEEELRQEIEQLRKCSGPLSFVSDINQVLSEKFNFLEESLRVGLLPISQKRKKDLKCYRVKLIINVNIAKET